MLKSLKKDMTLRWSDLSQAVLNKDSDPLNYWRYFIGGIHYQLKKNTPQYITLLNHTNQSLDGLENKVRKKRVIKHYYLGNAFPQVYFTRREAECALLMMHNLTIRCTADIMKLSPRTIEYYLKNMRKKTQCTSKKMLLDAVAHTDLLQVIDFTLYELIHE